MEELIIFFGFIFIAILIVCGFIGLTAGNTPDAFNSWMLRCRNDGGQVQLFSKGFSGDDYECYKDGKIIDHEN